MATWPPSEKVVSMSFHAGVGEIATIFGRRHSSYLYEMQTAFFGSQLAFFPGGGQLTIVLGGGQLATFSMPRKSYLFFRSFVISSASEMRFKKKDSSGS